MKAKFKKAVLILTMVMAFFAFSIVAFASTADSQESAPVTTEVTVDAAETAETADSVIGSKAMAAAITIGLAAACGAIGMALAISKSVEGIARQPEASGKIQTNLMLGLVFIETAIIYALIVAILIIFVM